ncbi:prolyl-tRNA synthetase [Pandoraea terrae]|uniref:Prolyl-tRNA synthetase n=1 Tax=Pandoraea terrae TaxID=1537710 RepID=A0A5E4X6Q4_9BURK|nr:YbaK/EbsC family protein [Pandoraea terrae]VVE32017.1 prolyl-tRNA synthetase [Pandoraea terrae]
MSIASTLEACLRNAGAQYEVVRHPHSYSSIETAEAAHIPGDRLAKTILLEDELGYVAAVLPSTHHLRLSKLWAQTGRRLTLAKEADVRETFKDCEVGAIPPIGTAYGMMTLMDESLASLPDIYFEAGDHEALIHMQTDQFMRLMEQAEKARFSHRMHDLRH